MPPKFGTSGLRGLVVDLTPDLVADHVRAFVAACETGTGLFVGRDLRDSSPAIAAMVMEAARAEGLAVTDCGAVPTPALALASMGAGAAAVMITGSHIPADRNGLKFYLPGGEIGKADEAAILAHLGRASAGKAGTLAVNTAAGADYVARYVSAYGAALAGLTIGVYSHSAVGRDLLLAVVAGLGATPVELGRSEVFIPVDTEAVDPGVAAQLRDWAAKQHLDAIVSTDGDGDRPLLTDGAGRVIPGDILGQITGTALGADVAVTPVSSNTGAEQVFGRVIRTRIGSPHVIAGMEQAGGRVVGYEANGGFLLGFDAEGPTGKLSALATRDAVLPWVAPLAAARAAGGLAALVADQPARFTAADRLQGVPTEASLALVEKLGSELQDRAAFLDDLDGAEQAIDRTDGLRMTLMDGRIVHLRPSGNAPELRLYVESDSADAAAMTLDRGLALLRRTLG
ncbi:phosphomannomutase [Loktanella sp. 3ANDIMAR09]|uniref:phosphomannomutase n=1 Tax=Loktanella sp. 3ANDIMAR09 TaxID=1225657 RepID=UPI0006F356EB|nr:phosphomannomutase [Loktanella sp. 3ANDIMAR09]KQI67141.1 phosphomannomutase [Loktanella sp. 3ANDIMAR09]